MRLDNPVLGRELIEQLRMPRAFIIQAVFLLLLSAIVLVAWPPEAVEMAEQAHHSKRIFDTFAIGQIILLALIAPILAAPSIASERERRSLDLLMTSPLTPGEIVQGKLLSAIVYLLLLSVSSLPIFAVCFLLGGIGWREIATTFALLFGIAFFSGSVGLVTSTFLGRSRNALAVSYVVILPLTLLLIVLNPARAPAAAVTIATLAFAISGALVFAVRQRLKDPFDSAPRAMEEEKQEEQLGLVLSRNRFPDNLLSPKGKGEPMRENVNPLFEKEIRFELFGRGTLLIRLILFVSLLAALPFFIASLFQGDQWVFGFYMLMFVILLAPSLAAGAFTQEREMATFDLLLTSSITPAQILKAKILANLRSIGVLTAFQIVLLFFAMLRYLVDAAHADSTLAYAWINGKIILGTLLVVAATTLFATLLSSLLSMICRTTLRSMVYSYLVVGFLFMAPPVAFTILTTLGRYQTEQIQQYMFTSPFYALLALERSYFHLAALERIGILVPSQQGWSMVWSYLGFSLGLSALFLAAMVLLYRPFCRFRHDRGL